MKQKPIEDRFHNARNDQSLVVIEGFHPLKHAIRFGVDLLEIVSPDLEGLKALQDAVSYTHLTLPTILLV